MGWVMNCKVCFGLAACCVLAWPVPGPAAGTPEFQLSDLQKIVALHDAKISPDGKQIAVVVSTPDWKTDKAQMEIDIVDAANGARRAVTWKRTGIASPKWSADGSRLAFLAEDSAPKAPPNTGPDSNSKDDADKDSEEKQAQIFVMPMNGGDPIRVTEAKHGVEEFAWSPDGKQIAFITADEPVNAKAIKEHDDAFQVTDNNFLTRAALTPWHLWVVSSSGGAAKRLTQGTFSLQTDQRTQRRCPSGAMTAAASRSRAFPARTGARRSIRSSPRWTQSAARLERWCRRKVRPRLCMRRAAMSWPLSARATAIRTTAVPFT